MPHCILDKAYRVNQSGGVAAHRVVVQGTNPGECKSPAAAGAGEILGVTTHAQGEDGRPVAVRKAGIALVEASGAIAVGVPVSVSDTSGKVTAINVSAGQTAWCLGCAETSASADGDLIEVFLSIHRHTMPYEP
jgi:Uncharacterized conserved protein (DUF2190)